MNKKNQQKNDIPQRNNSSQKSFTRRIYDTFAPGTYDPYKEEEKYKKTRRQTWNKSVPIKFGNKKR
jgi:hypothetical protein